MASPCFVHSQLDKGASLAEWLRNRQKHTIDNRDVTVAKSLQHRGPTRADILASPPQAVEPEDNDDDDGYGGSLTKQLAETANSVREWSKQLGLLLSCPLR